MFPAVVANPISDESLFELPSISVALSCVDPLPEDFDVILSRPSASCCALSETFIFDESTSGSLSSQTTAGDRIGTGTDEGDGIESGHTGSVITAGVTVVVGKIATGGGTEPEDGCWWHHRRQIRIRPGQDRFFDVVISQRKVETVIFVA